MTRGPSASASNFRHNVRAILGSAPHQSKRRRHDTALEYVRAKVNASQGPLGSLKKPGVLNIQLLIRLVENSKIHEWGYKANVRLVGG